MGKYNILIDTNIFFAFEDSKPIEPRFAEAARKSLAHTNLYLHESTLKDVDRDRDPTRRSQSLSKINKYRIIQNVSMPPMGDLVERFGSIANDNDEVDVSLLFALSIGLTDFLVSEDQGIHSRARRSRIQSRVMTVEEFVAWLDQTFEPKLPYQAFIESCKAHEIDSNDEIFDSLREGYPDFDYWWTKTCIPLHRDCWTVKSGSELAGIVVYKSETKAEAQCQGLGEKILKLCTFKVKPKFRGDRTGELLLRHSLWYAAINKFDIVYLTSFPNQLSLISLFSNFGFRATKQLVNGELYYERSVGPDADSVALSPLDFAKSFYPYFVWDERVKTFVVPIRPEFHSRLFPEVIALKSLPLFPNGLTFSPSWTHRKPGNTINKVYLCRSRIRGIRPGDVVLFYKSKAKDGNSQIMTSLGVVTGVNDRNELSDILRAIAKRSVFSEFEIGQMLKPHAGFLKVIDFMLMKHFPRAVDLKTLCDRGVFGGKPPQSTMELKNKPLNQFKKLIEEI